MYFIVNDTSNKKQYIERDNFVVADDNEILRIDCKGEKIKNNADIIFELYCYLLNLSDIEKELYYMLNYTDKVFKNFSELAMYASKEFNRNYRSYYRVHNSLIAKRIIEETMTKFIFLDEYNINKIKDIKYVVLKVK